MRNYPLEKIALFRYPDGNFVVHTFMSDILVDSFTEDECIASMVERIKKAGGDYVNLPMFMSTMTQMKMAWSLGRRDNLRLDSDGKFYIDHSVPDPVVEEENKKTVLKNKLKVLGLSDDETGMIVRR